MSFTDKLEADILDFLLGSFSDFTTPPKVYIMLSTTTPGETSGSLNFTEPSGNGYAAVEIDTGSTNWEYVAGVGIRNKVAIEFPEATGNWGTITHFGVEGDVGESGSVMIGTAALSAPKTVEAGDKPRFNAGSLIISLD